MGLKNLLGARGTPSLAKIRFINSRAMGWGGIWGLNSHEVIQEVH